MKTSRNPSPPKPPKRALLVRSSLLFLCVAALFPSALGATPPEKPASTAETATSTNPEAKVTGIKYNCVHVLQLERTLKLYREILGFKMVAAEVLKGKGIEGMLIMKMKAGDCEICLSLTAPEHLETIGPIGNTNHNHFMLLVNDITTIGDKLKAEGYELENDNYARDKYTFFTGPNDEIIGLTEYK